MTYMTIDNLDDLFDSSLDTTQTTFALNLSSKSIDLSEAHRIAGVLSGRKVNLLTLTHSKLTREALSVIAKALESVNYEISIYLNSNKIDDVGAIALAESLKNKKIQTLSLDGNEIGDQGAKALAAALKINQKVTLFLQDNKIGPTGAEALVKAWATHTSTRSIDLSKNRLGDEGARRIAEVLAKNSGKITSLYLRYNGIGLKGDLALAKYLPAQVEDVVYRVQRLNYAEYSEKHPIMAGALGMISLICLPLIFFLPFQTFDEDIPGLVNQRVNKL